MPVKHFVLPFSCCKRSSRSPKESIICWAEKGCDTIGDYSQSRLCYVLDLCARLSAAHCDLQFRCRFYYRIARDRTSFHLTQMRVRIVKLRVRRLWVADDGNNLMTIVVLTEAHIFFAQLDERHDNNANRFRDGKSPNWLLVLNDDNLLNALSQCIVSICHYFFSETLKDKMDGQTSNYNINLTPKENTCWMVGVSASYFVNMWLFDVSLVFWCRCSSYAQKLSLRKTIRYDFAHLSDNQTPKAD